MENPIEQKSESGEHTPKREEILAILGKYAENYTITREESDEQGPYLIEITVTGEAGAVTEYHFRRKGIFSNRNESSATTIYVVYFENGIPVGGNDIDNYDDKTGKWSGGE
jgi:hypothetical protein